MEAPGVVVGSCERSKNARDWIMLDPYSQRVAMGTQEVGSSLVVVIRGQLGWTLGGSS